ncbi:translation protein SH3-like domain-containing protein [Chytridium lagenaria]|nr:translation protein SH3-like domain-containing protein [Chytridium lagenaria]
MPLISALPMQVRFKTFVKGQTKSQKRYFKYIEKLKEAGEPLPPVKRDVMENKFWKVVGNMKIYKPVSPGCRHRRHPVRHHLHKGSCIRRLSYGKRSTGGRNKSGRITVRHQGGGHNVETTPGPHEVVRFEYDPNRSADLALLRNMSTNELSYILRSKGLNVGDVVESFRTGVRGAGLSSEPLARNQLIQRGNALRLRDIPVGTLVHCIGLKPDGPAQICRSAGTSGQLIATDQSGFAQVRLSSKEVRLIPLDCVATIGEVGNEDHHHRNYGKAGAMRRKGVRPTVRGIAMNACDHPTGGGSKSKGNKHPRSPWGWLTKGWKTVRRRKWYVITQDGKPSSTKNKSPHAPLYYLHSQQL